MNPGSGALLQRAGLALPVADSFTLTVLYRDLMGLMRDLRAMGEANALAGRLRRPTGRGLFLKAAQHYATSLRPHGQLPATFELVCLTGWAPHASQQKAASPGFCLQRLADAMNTQEIAVPRPYSD